MSIQNKGLTDVKAYKNSKFIIQNLKFRFYVYTKPKTY